MTREPPGRRALLVAFLVLEVLALVSWGVSSLGAVSAVVLAIAAVQAAVSAAIFMELWSAHPVHRAVFGLILFFIVLLCAGIAGDAALR